MNVRRFLAGRMGLRGIVKQLRGNFDFFVSYQPGGVYMTVQHSFSKIEKELLPAFRQQIGAAESTEDVKKFFVHTILDLLSKASEGELKPMYEDISLNHAGEGDAYQFNFSEALTTHSAFSNIWKNSDMQHIVKRFASSACNRHKHLEKNPEKTELKIRM